MTHARAQEIPGPADASRVRTERPPPVPRAEGGTAIKSTLTPIPMPEGVSEIHLVLKELQITGATAFTPAQLRPLYESYLGKDITLDVVYGIAEKITRLYRDAGYFLSMAYVPEQKIAGGIVRIQVIEGYIGAVEKDGKGSGYHVVQGYIDRMTAQRPAKANELESILLRINDLPGYDYRAVLSPMENAGEGAVKLTLVSAAEKGRGIISFDNLSSRYLGPNEASVSYQKSLLPMQLTGVSVLASLPADELRYLALNHSIAVAPDFQVNLEGHTTKTKPGYTLKPLEIESRSNDLSGEVQWQPVRQRDKNVALRFRLERRNTDTDFLDTPFTRDRIRVMRVRVNYDGIDATQAYNAAEATISRGIRGLGASKKGDPDISRAEAEPDFTKLEFKLTRLQRINSNFALAMNVAGQLASGPLYSAEEFGYGGQAFGRAFDSSEITGDEGIKGAIEVQYTGLDTGPDIGLTPYIFYDIGKIWNDDAGQAQSASGASAGLGVRAQTGLQTSLNMGLAYPLTRNISTPVYGSGEKGPRFFIQMDKDF